MPRRSNAMWGRPLPTLTRCTVATALDFDTMRRPMTSPGRDMDIPISTLYAAGPLQAERWRRMFPGTTVVVNAQIGA